MCTAEERFSLCVLIAPQVYVAEIQFYLASSHKVACAAEVILRRQAARFGLVIAAQHGQRCNLGYLRLCGEISVADGCEPRSRGIEVGQCIFHLALRQCGDALRPLGQSSDFGMGEARGQIAQRVGRGDALAGVAVPGGVARVLEGEGERD
jgi:hypothetical protein